MPRAPRAARSALLMATAAALLSVARAPHALVQLNPWLSACDLVHNASEDLQGVCMAHFHSPLPKHPAAASSSLRARAHLYYHYTNTITATTSASSTSSSTSTTTTTKTAKGTKTAAAAAAAATATATVLESEACPVACTTTTAPPPPPPPSSHRDSNVNVNVNVNGTTTYYNTTNQCLLYLEEAHKVSVCDGGRPVEQRRRTLAALRLRHCCEHAVDSALSPSQRRMLLAGGEPCRRHLDALLAVDALAARITCEFTEVLTRYDCAQPYSIVYHCDDCKEAYRRWVCSSLVPHLTGSSGRVRPCRSVCQAVEQRCPYLLPGDRAPAYPTQYAGEPTFLCLDPNIPETGSQRERSSHGDDDCCYTYCGGPGRPPCVRCPRGAPNTSWGPTLCAEPGTRATPLCRPIASRATVGSSGSVAVVALAAAVAVAVAVVLITGTTCTSASGTPAPFCSSLLTCCVHDVVCECARTTAPPRHTHTTTYTWTS